MSNETRASAQFYIQVATLLGVAATAYYGGIVNLSIAELRTHVAERYMTIDEGRTAHRELRSQLVVRGE